MSGQPAAGREIAPGQLLSILGDEAVQSILSATAREPMSARMLEERCEASLTTVYRRVETLLEHGLLRSRTEVRDDGYHLETYEATLERLDVRLDEGGLAVEVERRDDAPDRFRGVWDAMQGVER